MAHQTNKNDFALLIWFSPYFTWKSGEYPAWLGFSSEKDAEVHLACFALDNSHLMMHHYLLQPAWDTSPRREDVQNICWF